MDAQKGKWAQAEVLLQWGGTQGRATHAHIWGYAEGGEERGTFLPYLTRALAYLNKAVHRDNTDVDTQQYLWGGFQVEGVQMSLFAVADERLYFLSLLQDKRICFICCTQATLPSISSGFCFAGKAIQIQPQLFLSWRQQ